MSNNKTLLFEQVKSYAEGYMNDTYGAIYGDEFEVTKAGIDEITGQNGLVYMKSRKFENFEIVAKLDKNKLTSSNYLEIYSYESILRPALTEMLKEVFNDVRLSFHYSDVKYLTCDYKWTVEDYLKKEGVACDIYITESAINSEDVATYIDKFAEKLILYLNNESACYCRYISVIICENLPDAKVFTASQFDSRYNKQCHKKKYRSYRYNEKGKIELVNASDFIM